MICGTEGCEKTLRESNKTGFCGPHTQSINAMNKTICLVIDCIKFARTRGWCDTHYSNFRNHGDPEWQDKRIKQGIVRAPGTGGINAQGYIQFWVEGKMTLAHRIVMENMLGRNLLSEETVHHLNGDRTDNRPENLELWSSRQPKGQRVEDKISWAKELLLQYEDVESLLLWLKEIG